MGRVERLPERLAALESVGVATDVDRSTAAYQLLRAGRHQEAVPIIERQLAGTPDDPRARFNLGFAYMGLRRYADAEREFRILLARDPGNRAAWQNLLWIHRTTGDQAAHERTAAEMAAALGETSPQTPGAQRAAQAGSFRATFPPQLEVPAAGGPTTSADTVRRAIPTSGIR
jgi:predicted Zn-dependent protease